MFELCFLSLPKRVCDISTTNYKKLSFFSIQTLYDALDVERIKAVTDPMTRAWDRQGLKSFALGRLNKVADGKQVSPWCFDLDHFETVNDRYGNSIGDQILVQAARRPKAVLRAEDLLVLLGDEECALCWC